MCVPTSGFPALTQIAAALASSSLVFQQSDKQYANTLYYAAASLYGRVSDQMNQGLYSSVAQPNCRNPGDPLEVRPPPPPHAAHNLSLAQLAGILRGS